VAGDRVALGEALAGAGKKADALAKCKEALAIEGLPREVRTECEMMLKKLAMDSK
jgi:hypothetical protein